MTNIGRQQRVAHARLRADRVPIAQVALEMGLPEHEVQRLADQHADLMRGDEIARRWHRESDARLLAEGHRLHAHLPPPATMPASAEVW